LKIEIWIDYLERGAFDGDPYPNLSVMNMGSKRIETIDNHALSNLTALEEVNLQNNSLRKVEKDTFVVNNKQILLEINLKNNSFNGLPLK